MSGARTRALLQGPDASAPQALNVLVRGGAFDRATPLDRPYMRLADALALGGGGDLAQRLSRSAPARSRHPVPQDRPCACRFARALLAPGPGDHVSLPRTPRRGDRRASRSPRPWNDVLAVARAGGGVRCGPPDRLRGRGLGALFGARWLRRVETDGWYRARILFRLGEIYEQRGDRARAADHYGQFLELWRTADPELQPRVREARRRLTALTAEPARP